MRLVTFGCSMTQGIGLDGLDCFSHPRYISPQDTILNNKCISKDAWPHLLADKLDLKCVNLGRGGSSPKFVFQMIREFQFNNDDLVIIQWPGAGRHTIWAEEDEEMGTPYNPKLYKEMTPTEENEKHFYMNYYTDFDSYYNLAVLIESTHNYLKDRCNKFFSVTDDPDILNNKLLCRLFPVLPDVNPFFRDSWSLSMPIEELQLNKNNSFKCHDGHPGTQFHIDFVDDMLKIIK